MTNGTIEGAVARSPEQLDLPSPSSRAFEPLTRRLFIEAGLRPGMRVLDMCSGAGDVALLAREIVGPEGHVTGFDQSAGTVAYANERAAFRGLANVEFIETTVGGLRFGRDFDAVVGRIVLMFRADPVGDLRALARCLRPGGLMIFQELDMFSGKTVPPATVVDGVRAWLLDAFGRAGIELEMGPKLYATFKAAGLPAPEMRVEGFIGGAESIAPAMVAKVARTVLPQAEALGVTSAEEVQIDTLEERIRADLASTGGVMSIPLMIGAWARMPG
jgi:SAM-dependent methyltransferase